jgi:hypothetical protein
MDWLNYIMQVDVKNHYTAVTDVQRAHIRGGQSRLLDIRKRCLATTKVVSTKISGIKYGH